MLPFKLLTDFKLIFIIKLVFLFSKGTIKKLVTVTKKSEPFYSSLLIFLVTVLQQQYVLI